jgi:D-aminopeptidase
MIALVIFWLQDFVRKVRGDEKMKKPMIIGPSTYTTFELMDYYLGYAHRRSSYEDGASSSGSKRPKV